MVGPPRPFPLIQRDPVTQQACPQAAAPHLLPFLSEGAVPRRPRSCLLLPWGAACHRECLQDASLRRPGCCGAQASYLSPRLHPFPPASESLLATRPSALHLCSRPLLRTSTCPWHISAWLSDVHPPTRSFSIFPIIENGMPFTPWFGRKTSGRP